MSELFRDVDKDYPMLDIEGAQERLEDLKASENYWPKGNRVKPSFSLVGEVDPKRNQDTSS